MLRQFYILLLFCLCACAAKDELQVTAPVPLAPAITRVAADGEYLAVNFDAYGKSWTASMRWNSDSNGIEAVTILASEGKVAYTQTERLLERSEKSASTLKVEAPAGTVEFAIRSDIDKVSFSERIALLGEEQRFYRVTVPQAALEHSSARQEFLSRARAALGDAELLVLNSPEALLVQSVLESEDLLAVIAAPDADIRNQIRPLYATDVNDARLKRRMCSIAEKASWTCAFIFSFGGLPAVTCVPGAATSALCKVMDLVDPFWKDPPPEPPPSGGGSAS